MNRATSTTMELPARALARLIARGESLGPLSGVPVTIKECLDVAGTPSTFGVLSRRTHRAQSDDAHVARLKAAGAILVGKTNVAQLLAFVETDNPVYGKTCNPWNRDRIAGGSSGGEGAIIAAGGVPLGLGTDIGGSVRYPAAFCGIASLKPTAGRCEDRGRYSFHPGQRAIASQVGVLARHVDDVAAGLDAINGGPPIPDWRSVDMTRMRVGFYLEDGVFASSTAIRRSVAEAAEVLKDAGATVIPWQPPETARAFAMAYGILGADGMQWFRDILQGGPAHPSVNLLLMLGGKPRAMLNAMAAVAGMLGQASLARSLAAAPRACQRIGILGAGRSTGSLPRDIPGRARPM